MSSGPDRMLRFEQSFPLSRTIRNINEKLLESERLSTDELSFVKSAISARKVEDLLDLSIPEMEFRVTHRAYPGQFGAASRSKILSFAAALKAHALANASAVGTPRSLGLLPEFEPVRAEAVHSPYSDDDASIQMAIDNLPEEVQDLARAVVAPSPEGQTGSGRRRAPQLISIGQVDAAPSDLPTEGASLSDLTAAIWAYVSSETDMVGAMRAEVVLQRPGEQDPVVLASVSEGATRIELVPQVAYRGRDQADLHDLWATRTAQTRAVLAPGDRLQLALLEEDEGGQPPEPLELEEGETFDVPAGRYRASVIRDGKAVEEVEVTIPEPEESLVDLSRFVGYELRFPNASVRRHVEEDGQALHIHLEVGDAGEPTIPTSISPLDRSSMSAAANILTPGCYAVDVTEAAGFEEASGPVLLRFEVFAGGLARAHVLAGSERGPTIAVMGGGAKRHEIYDWHTSGSRRVWAKIMMKWRRMDVYRNSNSGSISEMVWIDPETHRRFDPEA